MGTTRARIINATAFALALALAFAANVAQAADALPSWNDGPAKKSIVDFVQRVGGVEFMRTFADAVREWAYDRESPIGKLDKALDEAKQHGWTLVGMKDDWKNVFASERQ